MKLPLLTVVPWFSMTPDRDEIQTYACKYTAIKPPLDGKVIGPVWDQAEWTKEFIDIRGSPYPLPRFSTKVKMLWDDEYLYIGAWMEEPHVWTHITKKNSVIYWNNDFEVFIDPDGDARNYYEFEVNALNTIWELTLDKPYNEGGTATHPTNIEGLISQVFVDGTINDPRDIDQSWSVEIAIPWHGLAKYNTNSTPPQLNDEWRINFSRVEWNFRIENGTYVRIPTENRWDVHEEENWVWSTQKEINMHIPHRWGRVRFFK
jgi:hypothetical protein